MFFTEKGRWGEGGPQMQNPTRAEVNARALGTLEHFADLEEEHPENRCWATIRRRPRHSQFSPGCVVESTATQISGRHREELCRGEQCLTVWWVFRVVARCRPCMCAN